MCLGKKVLWENKKKIDAKKILGFFYIELNNLVFFVTPLRSNLDMLPQAAAPPADGGALIGYDDWVNPYGWRIPGWVNPYGWRIPSEDDDDDGWRNHVNDDGTAPG